MKKKLLSFLGAAAMMVMALSWGDVARAYLAPDYTDPNATSFVIGPGNTPDYLTNPNWAYTPLIRKFVDTLPGLTSAGANNLGQYIPIATPDITTYPGSDYYVIDLIEYAQKMHTDLPATTLRGYVQANSGTNTTGCQDPSLVPAPATPCTTADNTVAPTTQPQYLGPVIIAQKGRPVRVLFRNKLPTGAGGDLFIPVDTTIMGSGAFDVDYDPVTKQLITPNKTGMFTQNRATLHLHGGKSPWISDGTPHQWITPAGETTEYPQGVSVSNVPDMPAPGPGEQNFFWTNQQSSRMMFYHDHAWGITRLNVYVGEAAGYLIQDPVEKQLIADGIIPAEQIPLVIEDKTYVDAATIPLNDPTWQWGTGAIGPNGYRQPKTGDLWWPHVYMPAQNPFDVTGIAPYGRWAYGPYFWPPTPNPYQPVANPYFSNLCDPADPTTPGSLGGYCQPPEIPGTPSPSWGAEAFLDTQTVNGTAYPKVTLQPKPYRFRILNASHDRFINLSLFKADATVDPNVVTPECANYTGGCATLTEVKMLPATAYAGFPASWPADGREGGVPDYTTSGPNWIMFGTEGGFLPQPVVIPPHPVNWNTDPTTFNAGNVNGGSLILGPAERADVVVDFSGVTPGTTLILYNDAPAPWPALDPHYDYFTGCPDRRGMGGADATKAGLGPNVRTVMQITIAGTPGTPFNLTALQSAFTHATGAPSVFERAQDPVIVAQGNMNPAGDPAFYEAFLFTDPAFSVPFDGYNKAYGKTFPAAYPNWGISRIYDRYLNFLGADGSTTYKYDPSKLNNNGIGMKFKAIHDEMGATWDEYGRLRASLGLELTNVAQGQTNFVVQTYGDPATEYVDPNQIQLWKITHNGVDTHPVHFHAFDVQIVNRVGWDGFIRLPDPTEIGWKDTVRISPLEDTIVALRPQVPTLPFGVPRSYRPMNPARPLGDTMELSAIDPTTGQAWAKPNVNIMRDYNWEYVWHCHILSHEENDMMRPVVLNYVEKKPLAPSATQAIINPDLTVKFMWKDNSTNEIRFEVERAPGTSTAYTVIGNTLANATSFTDTTVQPDLSYSYRVRAYNAAGYSSYGPAVNATVIIYPPATGVTLSGSPASPVGYSRTITFTAGGMGGNGNYEYKFLLKGLGTGGVWVVKQNYSTTSTWNWTPVSADKGTNSIMVYVRTAGTTTKFDKTASKSYSIIDPTPTGVSLTANPVTQTTYPNSVLLTAAATGGTGSYEYKFALQGPGTGGILTVKQAYSTSATWNWVTTAADQGPNSVTVYTRNVGSTAASEATNTIAYTINAPAVSSVSLTANPATTVVFGNPVLFTGTASGGSGTYEYQFSLNGPSTGNVWVTQQGYSSTSTWSWTPGVGDLGMNAIKVDARSAGNASASEATSTISNYKVTAPVATGGTITGLPATPVTAGTSVTFTATGSGGYGSYEFRFWQKGPGTGNAWVSKRAYSTTPTWTWTTSSADVGVTSVMVYIRSLGNTTNWEVTKSRSYTVNP